MNPSQILLYALLLVLIYLIYKYLFKGSSNKITSLLPAGTPYVVSEDTISTLNGGQQVFNYTVSIWIYVDNWEVKTGQRKPILTISDALDIYLGATDNNLFVDVHPYSQPATSSIYKESYANLSPMPYTEAFTSQEMGGGKKKHTKESFYGKVSTSATSKKAGKENFDIASVGAITIGGSGGMPSGLKTLGDSNNNNFTTVVPAIPLQSWTNITVGIHDKAIDIYINGKLTQSNLFPFVPAPVNRSITVTPNPGFIGWTSNFQYYPQILTPSQIDSMYKGGYTGSTESILSLLGKYSMKVVFVDNTQKT